MMWIEWNHDYRPHKDSSITNGRDIDYYHVQYKTKHQPKGIWVNCGDRIPVIFPLSLMVSECAPLVKHMFRIRAHNELGWSDFSVCVEGLVTLRRH